MTMGVALLLMPFFLLAHIYSIISGLPANGYTDIYEYSIAIAALFYFAIGLIYLRKSLKVFFHEPTVALTLLAIGAGTNLFYYATWDSGMSHVYSFFLFSVFVWLTIRWHYAPSFLLSVITGLVFGMITLIRPTNVLVILFFLFYDISRLGELRKKFNFLLSRWTKVALIFAFSIIPVALQMFYWKSITGNWIFWSYGDQRFYFDNPHIWEGLFGFKKGLFIYSPLLLGIIPGMWISYRMKSNFLFAVILFTLFNVYVIFSWWCWMYGGGFGSRAMVESFPLLALLFAVFISWCLEGGYLRKYLIVLFILSGVWLNWFQTYQAKSTLLHWDGMNANLYFKIFGSRNFPDNYSAYLTPFDSENAIRGLEERPVFFINLNSIRKNHELKIRMKGENQIYLCKVAGRSGVLQWKHDIEFPGNIFTMHVYEERLCALQTADSNFVCVHPDSTVTAGCENISQEQVVFKITEVGYSRIILQGYNGLYLKMTPQADNPLIASVPNAADASVFTVERIQ